MLNIYKKQNYLCYNTNMIDNKTKRIILLCGLLFLVALSTFIFGTGHKVSEKVLTARPAVAEGNSKSYAAKKIKVYVTGEVQAPGIYEIDSKKRALDAVKIAGGFTDEADVERVNLTKNLRDGIQINVPAIKRKAVSKKVNLGEQVNKKRSFRKGFATVDGMRIKNLQNAFVVAQNIDEDLMVSLNFADEKEFCKLPGIYPELAKRIVEYRKNHGFREKDELLQVRGITPQRFEKIYKYLSLQ